MHKQLAANVVLPAGTRIYSVSKEGATIGLPILAKFWQVKKEFKITNAVKKIQFNQQEWILWNSWNRGYAVSLSSWGKGKFPP